MLISDKQPGKTEIFQGFEEEKYHKTTAVSATGMKIFLQSPAEFWAKMIHGEDFKPSKAFTDGDAYHKVILEGMDALHDAYMVKPQAANFTRKNWKKWRNHITGKDDVLGMDLQGSPDVKFCDESTVQDAVLAGKIFEKTDIYDAFRGGVSEVTFFGTAENGLRTKCRMDRVNFEQDWIFDLKTTTLQGKSIERASMRAIEKYNYSLQAHWYLRLYKEATGRNARFTFIFVKKGSTPEFAMFNYVLNPEAGYHQKAETQISSAINGIRRHVDVFGTDKMWISKPSITTIQDDDFSPYYFLGAE